MHVARLLARQNIHAIVADQMRGITAGRVSTVMRQFSVFSAG